MSTEESTPASQELVAAVEPHRLLMSGSDFSPDALAQLDLDGLAARINKAHQSCEFAARQTLENALKAGPPDPDDGASRALAPHPSVVEVALRATLDAAYQALAEVRTLPDLALLIDRAEALRVVPRAARLSVAGINAWTLYKFLCEREAACRIAEMRAAGELAEHGGDRKSTVHERRLILQDLGVTWKQAHAWAKVASIPETELRGTFARADRAGRPVSEAAVVALGAARQKERQQAQVRAQWAQMGDHAAEPAGGAGTDAR